MLRGAQRGSLLLRNTAAASPGGRCVGVGKGYPVAARLGSVTRPTAQQSKWAFGSRAGQARFMSAVPDSLSEKKEEAKPEGFFNRVMGKESCVVRCPLATCCCWPRKLLDCTRVSL